LDSYRRVITILVVIGLAATSVYLYFFGSPFVDDTSQFLDRMADWHGRWEAAEVFAKAMNQGS